MSTVRIVDLVNGDAIELPPLGRVVVTGVRHNVNYYTRRVSVVHGLDAQGRLVDAVVHPEFEAERA